MDLAARKYCWSRALLVVGLSAGLVGATVDRGRATDSPADSALTGAVVTSAPRHESASLSVGNRKVFEFRAELVGYGPGERAKAARERVRDAVQRRERGERDVSVTSRTYELGTIVELNGVWVFTVAPGDVNPLTGENYEQLVSETKLKLQSAVAATLEQRAFSGLAKSIALSLLATVLFWLIMQNLRRVSRWAIARLEQAMHAREERFKLGPTSVTAQLGTVFRIILRLVVLVVVLALANVWITFVLKRFPYTYPWGDQFDDYVLGVGKSIGLAILHAIPSLVMLVAIFILARLAVRSVKLFFEGVRDERFELPGVDKDTAIPTQRLVILFVWLLAVAIAFPFIPGSGGTAFKGLSVLFGIMLSLGSSNVVSQAASGYMLMFSKALRVNDYVRIGDFEGTVISMGVLSTKIRTLRDEEINVPNAVIVSSITKNFTRLNRDTGAPLTITLTIGYNAPWRQVHAMMIEAAGKTPGVRREPAPRVLQTALSDFYVEYTLLVRLEEPSARARVLGALNASVQDVFNTHGVQIMSPHYEGDPGAKVWVPKEQWYTAPARQDEKESR